MNTRNIEHSLSNRISKEKEQYSNGRSNKTRKSDNSKRKKNIPQRVDVKTSQKTRISFPNKRDSTTTTK